MLTESGRVMAIEHDHLWVETISRSACGGCRARKGCGQSLLVRWAENNSYLKVPLDDRDPSFFGVGDEITLGIPEDVVVKSSLLIYCLPIALLVVGAAVGEHALGSETTSIIGALSGLALGGLLVKMYSVFAARSRRMQPVVLDLLT